MAAAPKTCILRHHRALYRVLVSLAEQGQVCPGNGELASLTDYARKTLDGALGHLADAGLVTVERRGNQRRVTITETGTSTATPPSWIETPVKPRRPVRDIAAKAIALSGRSPRDILSRSRFREHVRVRQVVFEFAVREGWWPAHIARVMGFDHSTVIHGRRVLPRYAKVEPETAHLIDAMQRELPPLPVVAA